PAVDNGRPPPDAIRSRTALRKVADQGREENDPHALVVAAARGAARLRGRPRAPAARHPSGDAVASASRDAGGSRRGGAAAPRGAAELPSGPGPTHVTIYHPE